MGKTNLWRGRDRLRACLLMGSAHLGRGERWRVWEGVMALAADNHFMILAQVSQTVATPEKLPPFRRSGTILC